MKLRLSFLRNKNKNDDILKNRIALQFHYIISIIVLDPLFNMF